jgi:hypothetical protein
MKPNYDRPHLNPLPQGEEDASAPGEGKGVGLGEEDASAPGEGKGVGLGEEDAKRQVRGIAEASAENLQATRLSPEKKRSTS